MICIVNFKTYPEATGRKAVELAKICNKVAKETGANIAIAVQATDIQAIANAVEIPVIAQHVDANPQGAFTGWITPEAAKEAGAVGSLLNHSEHQIKHDDIAATIDRLKKLEMISIICVDKPEKIQTITEHEPNIIAIEPPELIGGDVSVSTAQPDLITNSLEEAGEAEVICGAGIKTKSDVVSAIHLGAKGILVASGIVKSKNPEKTLRELVEGLAGHEE